MSTINSANLQVGQSVTPANNITLSTSAGGDLVVSKGASGALVEITRIKNNGEIESPKLRATTLKLTNGSLMTTPETGAFEFDGTNLYFTVGGVRKTVTLT